MEFKNKSPKAQIKNNFNLKQDITYHHRMPSQNNPNYILELSNNDDTDNDFKNMNSNMNYSSKDYDITESKKTSIASKIYEKKIKLLNIRIKEQDNNIKYLNERLKNYDAARDKITNLNLEINKLNEIIMKKNNTIQEFKDITDLSKIKLEELLKYQNELNKKINILEEENKKLKLGKGIYENGDNNINNNYFENYDKKELDILMKENNDLKKQISEKEKQIKYLNNAINKFRYKNKNKRSFNNNLIYTNYDNCNAIKKDNIIDFKDKYNQTKKLLNNSTMRYKNLIKVNPSTKRNYYYLHERSHTPLIGNYIYEINSMSPSKRYHNIDYSIRTDPNYIKNMTISRSKNFFNQNKRYNNVLKLRNNVEQPLNYSNYLFDNYANSFCRNCHK